MGPGTVTPLATGSKASRSASLPAAGTTPVSSPPAPEVPPTQPNTTEEAVRQSAQKINAFLKQASTGIEFKVDGHSNQVIVRVVDNETGQVLRQMPSEEMLAISQALDRVAGLLLNQKA